MIEYYKDKDTTLYNGDCLEIIKDIPDNSIDCIVTDPPYGISMLGKNWDKVLPSIDIWKECLRVLKSGAFAFIMCTPRQDCLSRMIINLEDTGFNTNFTSIYWVYSSGFPKATNVSKLLDKRLGIDRPIINEIKSGGFAHISKTNVEQDYRPDDYYRIHGNKIKSDEPQSEQAKQLEGSYTGFNPKPAVEIIIVVMKLLSEKSYTDQALNNWHGITWLNNCRIPYISDKDKESARFGSQSDIRNNNYLTPTGVYAKNVLSSETGRFPANLICSDDILNDSISRKGVSGGGPQKYGGGGGFEDNLNRQPVKNYYNDKGSFSRYFDLDFWFENKIKELPDNIKKTFPFIIESKPSKSEKNKGLDNLKNSIGGGIKGTEDGSLKTGSGNERNNMMKNNHPTVKSIKLMSYLITLGSREAEVILDPFMGSGSTNIAAKMLNRQSIGIEREENYIKIATERIKSVICQNKLF